MSAAAASPCPPARLRTRPASRRPRREPAAPGLVERIIVELALANDVRSGATGMAAMLRRQGGAARVEWWAPTDDGNALRLEVADGGAVGRRVAVPVGPAGVLVLTGDRCGAQLVQLVRRVAPVFRRRFVEEQLALRAVQLARRNEALEDFAALVAHELKAPLLAIVRQDDAPAGVACVLDIVDGLLELARGARAAAGCAPGECLDGALDDLGLLPVTVDSDLPGHLPLPPAALRLFLRNLVANAAAAGARNVRISAVASAASTTLVVDDDGTGLADTGSYSSGSGLGLRLCQRVAARYGGELELSARVGGGTRATLTIERA